MIAYQINENKNGREPFEVKIKLIVGLGNPGSIYEKTRHNIGFWLIAALVNKYNGYLKQESKFEGLFGTINISDCECMLLMPTTGMNLSGEAVRKTVDFYNITSEDILVVHDELDFIPGTVKLKKGGSSHGHKGVQSIIDQLNDSNFWHLRFGIGKPLVHADLASYVISIPNKFDVQRINSTIEQVVAVIPSLVKGTFLKDAQTYWHQI